MAQKTFKYTKDDVTIVWKPEVCIHSAICVKGLPGVFNAQRQPWIDMSQGNAEDIINQVRKCPSGAISYVLNNTTEDTIQSEAVQITNVQIMPNGPLLIKNECHITHSNGAVEIKKGSVAFCRCGASGNKPYCDGSHKKINFEA